MNTAYGVKDYLIVAFLSFVCFISFIVTLDFFENSSQLFKGLLIFTSFLLFFILSYFWIGPKKIKQHFKERFDYIYRNKRNN